MAVEMAWEPGSGRRRAGVQRCAQCQETWREAISRGGLGGEEAEGSEGSGTILCISLKHLKKF